MAVSKTLRNVPKVQLHCHLEGTLRASSFLDLARRHGVALRYDPRQPEQGFDEAAVPRDPEGVYEFADFGEFLMTFAAVSRALCEPEDYGRLAAEYVEDALAQNVRRAELFVSPSVWRFLHPSLDVEQCLAAMQEAFRAHADRLEVKLICDLTRNFGAPRALETAKLAAHLVSFGVIGIGLGGDERNFAPELFREAFDYARSEGLHCVAHAGEAAGADSVRKAVEILRAERIGHGVRALEDDDVVDLLRRRSIPLECSPTSNYRTGVASADAEHPLVLLDELGVTVTIDADDPALFRTSLTNELRLVEQMIGTNETLRLARNAIDASFAEPARKRELHEAFDRSLEPAPERRT